MVCASAVPGRWAALSGAIGGGFVDLPVRALAIAWRACQGPSLGIGDFRAWLACREMVARRRGLRNGRACAYGVAELAGLLGVTPRRARSALARLVAAGLLEWSEGRVDFPAHDHADYADAAALEDTIGQGRGSVSVPRRLLRHLARGSRPALIASALGVLLRCLSRRRAGWSGRGRIKASWIAAAFGVSRRQAVAARVELVALGWIAPEASDPWAENRWGRAYRIDLAWSPRPAGARSSPPPTPTGVRSSPPDLHPDPLPGREKNQDPAAGGPSGVQVPRIGGGGTPPRLEDVRPEDLGDTAQVLELHRQAVARGLASDCEADRLRVVAAAEHAMAIGKANPAGLFATLIRGKLWSYATQADEDRARLRLRRFDHGRAGAARLDDIKSAPTRPAPTDAVVVRAVRDAAIRAGIFRDPFGEFARLNPGWTRERWDRALRGDPTR